MQLHSREIFLWLGDNRDRKILPLFLSCSRQALMHFVRFILSVAFQIPLFQRLDELIEDHRNDAQYNNGHNYPC